MSGTAAVARGISNKLVTCRRETSLAPSRRFSSIQSTPIDLFFFFGKKKNIVFVGFCFPFKSPSAIVDWNKKGRRKKCCLERWKSVSIPSWIRRAFHLHLFPLLIRSCFVFFFEVSLCCHRSWGPSVWVIRLTCGIESCWPSPSATQ